jgi:hypothetical protein
MKSNKSCCQEKFKIKAMFLAAAMMFLSFHSYSLIILNRGDEAFERPKELDPVEMLIIEGAAYFLQSQADFLAFLNRVEMSALKGINYDELEELLVRAMANMEAARDAYVRLNKTAGNTPYNMAAIDRLKAFDYDGFQRECALNPDIFIKVRHLLASGDVQGVFKKLSIKTGCILNNMRQLKQDVDVRRFPHLKKTWRLNQLFLETKLFGQYAAQVFYRAFDGMD